MSNCVSPCVKSQHKQPASFVFHSSAIILSSLASSSSSSVPISYPSCPSLHAPVFIILVTYHSNITLDLWSVPGFWCYFSRVRFILIFLLKFQFPILFLLSSFLSFIYSPISITLVFTFLPLALLSFFHNSLCSPWHSSFSTISPPPSPRPSQAKKQKNKPQWMSTTSRRPHIYHQNHTTPTPATTTTITTLRNLSI